MAPTSSADKLKKLATNKVLKALIPASNGGGQTAAATSAKILPEVQFLKQISKGLGFGNGKLASLQFLEDSNQQRII